MVSEKDTIECLQLHERVGVMLGLYLWQGGAGRCWWRRGSQGRRRGRRGDWHAEASDTCRYKTLFTHCSH